MKMCPECYSEKSRITPLLKAEDCLKNHTQYICGIYEITGKGGRKSYKIFADISDLEAFLKKNPDKSCEKMSPQFEVGEYKEYRNTAVRKLTEDEIKKYLEEYLCKSK